MGDKVRVGIRIPKDLKKLIDRYLEYDPTYVNVSEFARSAFREKIRKDAPQLYEEIIDLRNPPLPDTPPV